MAGCDLAHYARLPVIDLVADDQESDQRAFGSGAAVNGLYEGLIQVMGAEPPVAGIVLPKRLLEVFFGRFAGEAGSLGMEGDYLPSAVNQNEKIAAGDLPHVSGCVLDGHRVGAGHEGARDG